LKVEVSHEKHTATCFKLSPSSSSTSASSSSSSLSELSSSPLASSQSSLKSTESSDTESSDYSNKAHIKRKENFKITSIHQITGEERIQIAKDILLDGGSAKKYRQKLIKKSHSLQIVFYFMY
jgi:hypothetical protein